MNIPLPIVVLLALPLALFTYLAVVLNVEYYRAKWARTDAAR